MDTPRRIPLQDLPLERFLIPSTFTGSKSLRKHKRPLSPSLTTPLNPAKRPVLDAEGITTPNRVAISAQFHPMLSNVHTVTPTRPSRLGNGSVLGYGYSQGTSPSQHSPSRKFYPKPTIESSTDPQSRHYPGFDIFRDNDHRRVPPDPRVTLPSQPGGNALINRSEEDKENVPLRRRAKKHSSKKRLSSGSVGSDASCFRTPVQTSKMFVCPKRTPFSARHPPR